MGCSELEGSTGVVANFPGKDIRDVGNEMINTEGGRDDCYTYSNRYVQ